MTEEKTSGCEGCAYEEAFKSLAIGGYIVWTSSNSNPHPHPCSCCKRFPSTPIYSDNYVPMKKADAK